VAAGVLAKPDWAPCGQCDCVDGINPMPRKWEIPAAGIVTQECPRRALPGDLSFWAGLIQPYRNGVLWTGGGYAEQPAIYLDVVQTLVTWVDKLYE